MTHRGSPITLHLHYTLPAKESLGKPEEILEFQIAGDHIPPTVSILAFPFRSMSLALPRGEKQIVYMHWPLSQRSLLQHHYLILDKFAVAAADQTSNLPIATLHKNVAMESNCKYQMQKVVT